MNNFKTIELVDDKLKLINQTLLPLREEYVITDDLERISVAIERLEVRGAPAIGVAAAYGLALALKNVSSDTKSNFEKAYNRLASTRPTAVNLFYALNEMKKTFDSYNGDDLYKTLLQRAVEIHEEDRVLCDRMAQNGLNIFPKNARVLTHCNAGQLATGGAGTAVAVITKAYEVGLVKHVYADETRPLLQGSRLTAFELDKSGIPFSIQPDLAAGVLMQQGKIDLVITGADRVAANGDAANKIGTYTLAVLCRYHNIPFYIAAPYTTIDRECATGKDIKIEMRASSEVTSVHGVQITKPEYDVFSPAFDVTPNDLIHGIITEEKLFTPPYEF